MVSHLSLSGAAGLPSFMSLIPLQSKPPCQIAWFTEPVAAPGQRTMLLTPFQAERLPEKVQSPSAGLAQLIPGAQGRPADAKALRRAQPDPRVYW